MLQVNEIEREGGKMKVFDSWTREDYLKVGIAFEDPGQVRMFTDFVCEEYDARVAKCLSEGLSNRVLEEFDRIRDEEKAREWLEKNCPEFRTIVREQWELIIWCMLVDREKISTASCPDPATFAKTLMELGMPRGIVQKLRGNHIYSVKGIIDRGGSLSGLRMIDEREHKEIIGAVVRCVMCEEKDSSVHAA